MLNESIQTQEIPNPNSVYELRLAACNARKAKKFKKRNSKDEIASKTITPEDFDLLMKVAKTDRRDSARNILMIYLAYRHGLRVSELCMLEWEDVKFDERMLDVRRLKDSKDTKHPLDKTEMIGLGKLKKIHQEKYPRSTYVFNSYMGLPIERQTFYEMFKTLCKKAGLKSNISPHSLRHGCGYRLANDGKTTRDIQDFLGHKCISNTVGYTELAKDRFKDF